MRAIHTVALILTWIPLNTMDVISPLVDSTRSQLAHGIRYDTSRFTGEYEATIRSNYEVIAVDNQSKGRDRAYPA